MLDVRPLQLPDVLEIRPARLHDARGFLSEVWNREAMAAQGVALDFVQDNHSACRARGVLRGLHFQANPAAQDKLVRVTRGAVFDVAVDIRRGSATFGKWVGVLLSAEKWNQLLVPKGFAHGFVSLEPETEIQYKLTAAYRPDLSRAIRFDDPDIAIDWPVPHAEITLSDADRAAPRLAMIDTGF